MTSVVKPSIRAVQSTDQNRLANLIHFETHVHRHLDWRQPLDWINDSPFVVAESGSQIYAALACPPDPVEVAWIRLFAVASGYSVQESWHELWLTAETQLRNLSGSRWAASIPIWEWFASLLRESGFDEVDRVIMLHWDRGDPFPDKPGKKVPIRSMNIDDLSGVYHIDNAAFEPVWRNSLASIQIAYKQAEIATVVEIDSNVVGYQISSPTPMGGHLARLAVLPEFQGQGIGCALLYDTLEQFVRQGAQRVSVNTQMQNQASLALYQKAGFKLSGEDFPFFQYTLD